MRNFFFDQPYSINGYVTGKPAQVPVSEHVLGRFGLQRRQEIPRFRLAAGYPRRAAENFTLEKQSYTHAFDDDNFAAPARTVSASKGYNVMMHVMRLIFTLAATLPLSATAVEMVRYEGILVDIQCYVVNKEKLSGVVKADRKLLQACSPEAAKSGIPVALWNGKVTGGELVTLASPAYLLAEHLSRPARLEGELLAPRVVKPTRLEVNTPDGWVEVPTNAML